MTQYINKSAVVAEIDRVLNSYDPNEITSGRYALASLRDFLDTLEVKEVDLEKEIQNIHSQFYDYYGVVSSDTGEFIKVEDIINVAKHFFELGLQVNNHSCSEVKGGVEYNDSDLDIVLSELGVEPDSSFANSLKNAFYNALDNHLNKK